jgi:hypothetical protein
MDSTNHQTPALPAEDHQNDAIDAIVSPTHHAGSASPAPQPATSALNLPLDWSMEHVNAAPQAHLLEEAWFGREFKKQQPRCSELKKPGGGTGASSMQGPDLASIADPKLEGKVPATLPHVTNSSLLDTYLAVEPERRDTAADKVDQLIRNGLAVTSSRYGTLKPLLALPGTLTKKQARKRRAASKKLVNNYEYQSSGDELGPKPKVKFANLKHALSRLEQPRAAPKAAKAGAKGAQKSLKRKATETEGEQEEGQQPAKRVKLQTTWVTMPAGDLMVPTLEFQKAMRDPGHPGFGLSFLAAWEFAMAKEMKTRTLESTLDH